MATVYDKSSLFLAPSGVSNGTVFVQKPVPIYGSEQVTNGDFSQTGAEVSSDVNFDNPSNWSLTGQSTVSNGVAHILQDDTSNTGVTANTTITNKTYRITGVVSDYVSGSVGFASNGSTSPREAIPSQNGEFTIYYTSTRSTLSTWNIQRISSPCNLKIDNVSVKEVGQDWTLDSGWSIGEDKALFDGGGVAGNISQLNVFESGKTYKITFDTLDTNGGNLAYRVSTAGFVFINAIAANTKHTITTTAASSGGISLRGADNFAGSVTNISVQEVLSPDGDFTFTRGSNLSATRVNEAQLIEKGRENVLLQSNNFSQNIWVSQAVTRTSGEEGYDGSSDAWIIKPGSTSAARHFLYNNNFANNGVNTMSAYVKYSGYHAQIRVYGIGDGEAYANFDLQNGTKGTSGGNSIIDSSITGVGNGWYRISLTLNNSSAYNAGIGPIPSPTSSEHIVFTGDGTSGIFLQDFQLEQGLVATPYIETGASTVQAGLLENIPRLDYSGGATCPSLLLEPSRSNLVTQSEYTGDYNGINTTQEFNALVSPEGVQNAVKIVANTAYSQHNRFSSISTTGAHTFSAFAKAGGYNFAQIYGGGASGSRFSVVVDLTDGSIDTYDNITTDQIDIQDYGSGWYRIVVSNFTLSSTFFAIAPIKESGLARDAGYDIDYAGDNSSGVYFYGLQCEAGIYATSYIPTYGTSQTRAQEVCENGGSAESINSVEGVAFVECSFLADDVGENRDFYISDGTATNRIRIRFSSSDVVNFLVYNGSVQADINYTLPNPTNNNKIAVKWKANDFALWVNGTERGTDTSGTTFSTNTLDDVSFFTTYNQSQIFHSNVKQVAVFNEALSNLDLAILTGATTYETFDEMALALNYTVYE